ncbi:MAG: hypothetical protein KF747_03480 [Nitrospira sp.]|nr:hypothetical protein [Nitrospira sp.]
MSMSAQTLIVNLKTQLGVIGKGWSQGSIATRDGWLNRLITELEEEYEGPESKILNNEHLNQAGKMAAIRNLGTKFLPTVAWLKTAATRLGGEDKGFRTLLYAVKSPIKDELRRELRNGDIRRLLVGQNQAERDTQFFLAAEQDRDEVLDAMLDSPMGPMVSEEMKQRALDARAQRQHPNDYAAFQQNTLLLEYAHMLQELVGRRLYGIGVDAAKIKDVLGVTVASEDEVRRPSVTAEQYVGTK